MIASYLRKREAAAFEDFGLERQAEFFEREADRLGPCAAGDRRQRRARQSRAACCRSCATRSAFPGTRRCCAGRRAGATTDGPWAPHWYGAVEASTGFGPPETGPVELPDDARRLADRCRPYYERLAAPSPEATEAAVRRLFADRRRTSCRPFRRRHRRSISKLVDIDSVGGRQLPACSCARCDSTRLHGRPSVRRAILSRIVSLGKPAVRSPLRSDRMLAAATTATARHGETRPRPHRHRPRLRPIRRGSGRQWSAILVPGSGSARRQYLASADASGARSTVISGSGWDA